MSKVVRLLLISSFIFTLVITPIFAHADDEDSENGAQHRLEVLREKRDEAKQRFEDKREEIRAKQDTARDKVEEKLEIAKQKIAERIQKILAIIIRRLNAALTRLDKIAERIASRIDKLQEKGVDTSAAEAQLAEAEALGAAASLAISDAVAALESIDTTDTSVREAMHEAKAAIGEAKDALKAYHKGLVEAIRELKAASNLREGTGEADTNEE
ncbi:hypothetical protein A3J17_01495 [Candidatus Curtissbacteria bacterium RIFCSPLOWO2_02_FULL_40_11]|uniref:DUF5667 domain-containing protein n=2 Tax=Candidatus Curtissiibacteriota TaxID=1752717 RepID=A0A1F5G9C9_9BACT|nr:MAG: hypothetical protein A3D04_01000 [Candidatus Curtissbacteria bacterium RIFCSPHIGHO2_02_FULL_40_16b]OGE00328.1 MAG: hypothetical protein A3J17_01495 [Candidatus Curtissbacteria bacterium RIFCSPLOWO2_02_FULL_40_11]OGE14309.1 MAG: hypothetical protein A3G14_04060 [Candidatus Curtissbacteria bacterium RIFCSPLOWO2_12_FULL_38_9]